jgi:hypothetical protein
VAESTVCWFIVRENTAGWLLIPLNSSNGHFQKKKLKGTFAL